MSSRGAQGTPDKAPSPLGFVVRVGAWVVLFFGALRIPWIQAHLLLPFAGWQGDLACSLAGTDRGSVVVDFSCTGADAMALCLGTVLAFPASWRQRFAGGAAGLLLISALNTLRIASVSRVVERADLFRLLHVYVWPAILVLVAAMFVFAWMRWVERGGPTATLRGSQAWRFGLATAALLLLYYAVSPWLYSSDLVLALARAAAGGAGRVMQWIGVEAEVTQNRLYTSEGAWVVTQECVATPLIPVYLAAVAVVRLSFLRRCLALLVTVPLFVALGSARLLVLALPTTLVGSHDTAVHGFYQALAAAVLLVIAARRANVGRARVVAAGALGAVVFASLQWAGEAFARMVPAGLGALHLGHGWSDPQRALVVLPAFQLGFWLALWWVGGETPRGRELMRGVLLLVALQVVLVVTLGELAIHLGLAVPVVFVRLVALAGPLALHARGVIARAPRRGRGEWVEHGS